MSLQSVPVLYTDDGAHFGGREYQGCFSINEVRQRLDQPLLEPHDARKQEDCPGIEGETVTVGNHFLPSCPCAALHATCGASHDESIALEDVELSLEQLRESSEAGCWFCAVLYGGIMAAPPWDTDPKARRPNMHKTISIAPHSEAYGLSISPFTTDLLDPDTVARPLVFYVDEDEAAESPCRLFPRKIAPSSDPHSQLAFIKRNLQDCVQQHFHSCTPSGSSYMPTRLLHISVHDGKYSLRLVEGTTPRPYVTLSHCWGKSLPANAKTTAANLASRKSRVLWTDLTQNFRDAVAVTERLGFKYLWIDALCIIQDSASDWASESSRMCDVYSSSALMLSADTAVESDDGFFASATISTNPWRPIFPMNCTWRNRGIKLHYAKTHAYEPLVELPSFWERKRSSINKRAWCFQESRLSQRIAHFAVDEVLWDCTQSEGDCQCQSGDGVLKIFNDWIGRGTTPQDKLYCWLGVVSSYSARDLSFWTDRLPALSGLAKQFMVSDLQARNLANQSMARKSNGLQALDLANQSMVKKPSRPQPRNLTKPRLGKIVLADPDPSATGIAQNFNEIDLGTYLAGNWSNFLMTCLCWSAGPIPGRRLNTTAAYVAPSWSWASVSGVVSFAVRDARSEIVSACCHPSGPDSTGQISGGELILKAKLLPARLFRSEWNSEYSFPGVSKCVSVQADVQDPVTDKWVDAGPYHPDFIEQKAGAIFLETRRFENDSDFLTNIDGDYFAMPLAESFSLILKAAHTKNANTFERIGSIQKQRSWIGPDSKDETANWALRQNDKPEYWRVWEMPKHLFEAIDTQTVNII